MFFSAARPRTASTISLDMTSVSRYEVGAGDLLVGDRDHALLRGDRHIVVRCTNQLAGHASMSVPGLPQANARVPAQITRVVLRLGQGTVLSRGGHLERVAVAILVQQSGDALAHRQRHALGVIDEQSQRPVRGELGKQDLDVGLANGKPALDLGLEAFAFLSAHSGSPSFGKLIKKAGSQRPLWVLPPDRTRRSTSGFKIAPWGQACHPSGSR